MMELLRIQKENTTKESIEEITQEIIEDEEELQKERDAWLLKLALIVFKRGSYILRI